MQRDLEGFAFKPRQRLMEKNQQRNRCKGEGAEYERLVRLHGCRRDHDRRQKQDREGVLQAAGQVKKAGKLQQVIGQKRRRLDRVQSLRGRKDNPERYVEPGR